MYTVRECHVEEEQIRGLTHEWFKVKTLEEAERLILKRNFKAYKDPLTGALVSGWQTAAPIIEGTWGNNQKVWFFQDQAIYKVSDMRYELVWMIGPQTCCVYLITEE